MPDVKTDVNETKKNIIPFRPSADFYFTQGVQAFQRRQFVSAEKWMKKAIEEAPTNPLYQCQLSVVYTELGLYHEANQLLINVVNHVGEDYVDCYYLMANNDAHLGLLNDAKEYARLYLEKNRDGEFSDEALELLELLEMDDEEWDLIEDDLLIYQETIFYYMENLQWEKALPLLEEITTLFPEYIVSHHDMSEALFYLGREEEAIQMELNFLNEEEHCLYSYINLAHFYFEQNKQDEYEWYIRSLLNIYPFYEYQQLRLAVTLAQTGHYDNAYARFRSLAERSVSSHMSYYRWFSLTAFQVGEKQRAEQLWQEGCLKHPDLKNERVPWSF